MEITFQDKGETLGLKSAVPDVFYYFFFIWGVELFSQEKGEERKTDVWIQMSQGNSVSYKSEISPFFVCIKDWVDTMLHAHIFSH